MRSCWIMAILRSVRRYGRGIDLQIPARCAADHFHVPNAADAVAAPAKVNRFTELSSKTA